MNKLNIFQDFRRLTTLLIQRRQNRTLSFWTNGGHFLKEWKKIKKTIRARFSRSWKFQHVRPKINELGIEKQILIKKKKKFWTPKFEQNILWGDVSFSTANSIHEFIWNKPNLTTMVHITKVRLNYRVPFKHIIGKIKITEPRRSSSQTSWPRNQPASLVSLVLWKNTFDLVIETFNSFSNNILQIVHFSQTKSQGDYEV